MLEIRDANHAKAELAYQLMFSSGHQIVCTEVGAFNNPDILSLTKSDRLIEYEIKLSRADLMGELNSVKECKNQIILNTYNEHARKEFEKSQLDLGIKVSVRGNVFEPDGLYKDIGKCSKLDKHRDYLIPRPSERTGYGYYEPPYRPNYFYFAVTAPLVDLAVKVCEGTAYGVICLNDIYGSSSIKSKAGMIHRDEATRAQIWSMAHSLSFGYWTGRRSM